MTAVEGKTSSELLPPATDPSSKCPPGRTAQATGTLEPVARESGPVPLILTRPVRLVCRLPPLVMTCDNQFKYYFAKMVLQEILEHLKSVFFNCLGTSLVTEMVKNLPAKQDTWVRSLGQEDPQEKGMATRSSILAWRIPWTEESGGLQSMGSQ